MHIYNLLFLKSSIRKIYLDIFSLIRMWVFLMFDHIKKIGIEKQVSVQLEQFNPVQLAKFLPNQQQDILFNVRINLLQFAYQMHLSKPA